MDPEQDRLPPYAYGSGRVRLPLPDLGPDLQAASLHRYDSPPDFVPFRSAPRHLNPQLQIQQSGRQTTEPAFFDHPSRDPFLPSNPPLRRNLSSQQQPFQRQPFQQQRTRPGDWELAPSTMYSRNTSPPPSLCPQQGHLHAHSRDRFDEPPPLQYERPVQQRSDQQSSFSSMATGDYSSSPAAQAALRHSRKHNTQFAETLSLNVPVPHISSPRASVTQLVPSSSPSPHLTPRPVPATKRWALPHAPPFANGIQLIDPKERIPARFQSIFPYGVFNAVQSKCFDSIYTSSDNVVVSAPTGSGKTVLLELAICKLISQKDNDNAKIVYIAPTKALCKEKAEQWRKKFAMVNMLASELTGDTSRAEMRTVREAKIIVTTPEKWDSITRSWKDHRKLLDLVELFLIDEVHMLKESRGATLEAVVSRMKTYGAKVRFVALSATVPNSDDIATWLGRNHQNPGSPAHREVFGEEFRPVKLQKFVHGIDSKLADHPFDKYLNNQLWKYIEMHTQKKPMLVFCMTRKSCQEAAQELAKQWSQRLPQVRLWPEPKKRIPVIDASLQELVRYGVAFHHAGLDADDRNAVHKAFEEGHLSVICCTSTLAVGINLPCHTVVLKGTVCYQDGRQLGEYSDLEVMQMLGRAGRPQYEDSALAIILTRSQHKKRYEDLESGQQILESTLHKNLIEHLNSEISLGTFQDSKGAKTWLSGTFLSVRLHQNPQYYADLAGKMTNTGRRAMDTIEEQLEHICEYTLENLRNVGLINGEANFQHTEYGRAMSKYMIQFETMKMLLDIPYGAKTLDLLHTLCEASEFKDIRWQANERDTFRDINKDPFIMYPVQGNVVTVPHKVLLLVQMELGRVELANVTGFERHRLREEARRVLEVMHRLIRAVIECKGSEADGAACWAALELARSMAAHAWEGRPMQLLQIPQVGPVMMRKLVSQDIRTVFQLLNSDPVKIERIASRNPPYGKKLLDSVAHFPRLTISTAVKDSKVDLEGKPVVHVDALLGCTSARGKWHEKIPMVIFLAVTSGGVSAHFCRESLNRIKQGDAYRVHFTWRPITVTETLICRFACEEIVGTVVSTEVHHNLGALAFPTEAKTDPPGPARLRHNALGQVREPSPFKDEIEDQDMLDLWDIPSKRNEDTNERIESNIGDEFKPGFEDEDLLELWDVPSTHKREPPGSRKSKHDDEIKQDTDDDDLFAMVDRDGNIEQRPVKYSQVVQTNKRGKMDRTYDREPGRSVSSCGETSIQKQQPRSRRKQEKCLGRGDENKTDTEKPIRLPNGRYKCAHPCSQTDGGTTVRGDKCGHDCCRNGNKHPPKRSTINSKPKEQSGDPNFSDAEEVPDFSRPEPPRKRVRMSDSSSIPQYIQSGPKPRPSPARPSIDLSLYEVDEDGMIDLTQDFEPADKIYCRHEADTKLGITKSLTRQGNAIQTALNDDDLIGELCDEEIMHVVVEEEKIQGEQREPVTKGRKSKPAGSSNSPFSLLNYTRGNTQHPDGSDQETKRPPIEAPRHKIRPSAPRQKTLEVALSGTLELGTNIECRDSMDTKGESVCMATGISDKHDNLKPSLRDVAQKTREVGSEVASDEVRPSEIDRSLSGTETCVGAAVTGQSEHEKLEPPWLSEFDAEFISEFRGLVDFT